MNTHNEQTIRLAERAARKANQADVRVNQAERDRLLHEAQTDALASIALSLAYNTPRS